MKNVINNQKDLATRQMEFDQHLKAHGIFNGILSVLMLCGSGVFGTWRLSLVWGVLLAIQHYQIGQQKTAAGDTTTPTDLDKQVHLYLIITCVVSALMFFGSGVFGIWKILLFWGVLIGIQVHNKMSLTGKQRTADSYKNDLV